MKMLLGSGPSSSSGSSTSLTHIPTELFADKELFLQVVNSSSWESVISAKKKEELMDKFLPQQLNRREKEETISLLLNNSLLKFDKNPLDSVYFQLRLQRLAPDLVKTLEDVKQLRTKALQLQEQEYQMKLFDEVLAKRKNLFEKAVATAPEETNNSRERRGAKKGRFWEPSSTLFVKRESRRKLILRYQNVRKRYLQEMQGLNSSFGEESLPDSKASVLSSDDEEEDPLELLLRTGNDEAVLPSTSNRDSSSPKPSKTSFSPPLTEQRYIKLIKSHKRKRKAMESHLSSHQSSHADYDPLMDTSNITLNDVINRVTNASEEETPSVTSSTFPGSISPVTSNKIPKPSPTPSTHSTSGKKKSKPSNASSRQIQPPPVAVTAPALAPVEGPPNQSLDFDNISIKKEPMDVFDFDNDSLPESLPLKPLSLPSSSVSCPMTGAISGPPSIPSTGLTIIPAPVSAPSPVPVPVHVTTFPSIIPQPQSPIIAVPLPVLPPLLSSSPEPLAQTLPPPPPPPLLPPLPPPPHVPLEKSPLCFFSLLRNIFLDNSPNDHKLTLHKLEELVKEKLRCFDPKLGWSHEMVQSAMNYLSGVLPPPEMVPLVDYKEKNQQWQWIGSDRDSDLVLSSLSKEWANEKDKNSSTSLMDPSQPVPPAFCPTDWVVRPSNDDERTSYRDQEALRYNNPHKAFTFRIHSYESVVGPVKGCGIGSSSSHSSSPNKAREHSLLVSDRPPFVTLLSLVRDAAARLPNGEGTRADICELLKDSQYLLPSVSDQQVNGIVSGALDRLHYEKDPCVKYDVNRKVWIYLHRNRSEQQFERLHEVQVAAAKAKRSLNKTQRRTSNSTNSSSTRSPGVANSVKQAQAKTQRPASAASVSSTSSCVTLSSPAPSPQLPVSAAAVVSQSLPQPQLQQLIQTSVPTIMTAVAAATVTSATTTLAANFCSLVQTPAVTTAMVSNLVSTSSFVSTTPSEKQVTNTIAVSRLPSLSITAQGISDLLKAKTRPMNQPIVTSSAASVAASIAAKKKPQKLKILKKEESAVSEVSTSAVTSLSQTITCVSIPTVSIPSYSQLEANIPTSTNASFCKLSAIKGKPVRQIKQNPNSLQSPSTLGKSLSMSLSMPQQKQPTIQTSCNEQIQQILMAASTVSKHTTVTLPAGGKLTMAKQPIQSHPQVTIPKQIQLPLPQTQHSLVATPSTSTIGTTAHHQISIPTNMLFGGRTGSVVLATPAGKSYVMAASGGQIVLQPQHCGPTATVTGVVTTSSGVATTTGASLAVRTLQGIKVIPVPANAVGQRAPGSIIATTSHQGTSQGNHPQIPAHHQLVARIISSRAVVQPAQIVIPSTSAFQPVLLAPAHTQHSTVQTPVQVTPAPVLQQQQQQQIAIAVQPSHHLQHQQQGQQQPALQTTTTITLPIQTLQKRP